MRVLLISPVDPKVPSDLKYLMGGENTYTQTLLSFPPEGVEFVHHLEALKSGEIRYGRFHKLLSLLIKFRVLPLSAGTIDIEVLGDFDLAHCHAYSLRLSGKKALDLPVILGDSIPTYWSLFKYFKQSAYRVEFNYLVRRILHRMLNVYDQDLFLGDFSKLVVMSEFSKKEHLKLGADLERTRVVYPGLPDRGIRKSRKDKVRILFAGVWFKRKGGEILLKAYSKIRNHFGKKVELNILGPIPRDILDKGLPEGVLHQEFVPYSRLVGDVYPNSDVIVHVPPEAEGYGLVVQEAMSFGIPAVVTKVGALPEMVIDKKTGLVINPGSIRALEKALDTIVSDDKLRLKLGRQARDRYLEYFSIKSMHKKLSETYNQALEFH